MLLVAFGILAIKEEKNYSVCLATVLARHLMRSCVYAQRRSKQ